MFNSEIYAARRERLRKTVGSGMILLMGNNEAPMNYPGNTYHFRQDSTFLYYFGLNIPGMAAVLDCDSGKDILFANDIDIEDIIWMGVLPSVKDLGAQAGISITQPLAGFQPAINQSLSKGRRLHYLPPYRYNNKIQLHEMLGIPIADLKAKASVELIKAVVAMRSIKDALEVAEIEKACAVGVEMHLAAMRSARPGMYEYEISGLVEGIALSKGCTVSFPVICSIHGETLHNHHYNNLMKEGDLLITDAGAETAMNYASDYTRTFPVGKKFTSKQREIYEIVLKANEEAIKAIKPGIKYQEVHLVSAKTVAEGLIALGLMKGNADEAVKAGAHAMFFPHGLGHMMGLDVHDMEDLGENYVGYDEETSRIDQFGTAYLRLGRRLQTGFVMTVEPGIYFIPALIESWKKEGKHAEFYNFPVIEKYLDFGGIRIEDDALVTNDGHKVLGPHLAKTVDEIENLKS